MEGVVSCIIKPEPGKALPFTRSWREGENRLKAGTEQFISSLPQADVPRDYGGAELESAAVPPQTPPASLALRLGFAAGFSAKSGQGQPWPLIPKAVAFASAACSRWTFIVQLPFSFLYLFSLFFFLFQISVHSSGQSCTLFSLFKKINALGICIFYNEFSGLKDIGSAGVLYSFVL